MVGRNDPSSELQYGGERVVRQIRLSWKLIVLWSAVDRSVWGGCGGGPETGETFLIYLLTFRLEKFAFEFRTNGERKI